MIASVPDVGNVTPVTPVKVNVASNAPDKTREASVLKSPPKSIGKFVFKLLAIPIV